MKKNQKISISLISLIFNFIYISHSMWFLIILTNISTDIVRKNEWLLYTLAIFNAIILFFIVFRKKDTKIDLKEKFKKITFLISLIFNFVYIYYHIGLLIANIVEIDSSFLYNHSTKFYISAILNAIILFFIVFKKKKTDN